MSFIVVFPAHQKATIISANNMSEVNMTKNRNARGLKISEDAPRYPYSQRAKNEDFRQWTFRIENRQSAIVTTSENGYF